MDGINILFIPNNFVPRLMVLSRFHLQMLFTSLRGHKDQITCLRFLSHPNSSSSDEHVGSAAVLTSSTSNYILSSSKDSLLKLWDLTTQHCIETLVAHRGEIWSIDVSNDRSIIVTGGSDAELKTWRIDWTALDVGVDENGMDMSEDMVNENEKETGEVD